MSNNDIGIIILAAGGSSRFGKSKQLLKLGGKTLIRRAAENALRCQAGPVAAILGNEYEKIRSEIADLPIEIFLNPDWKSGIASSIKLGVQKILHERPDISAVIFTLCDQPGVDHQTLTRLTHAYRSKSVKIVASSYENTVGVPALFDASLFEDLMNLTGDTGAKSVINKHFNEVMPIQAPEAVFDVDSEADYDELVQFKQKERTT